MGSEKALGAVKVIKDQIQYRSQSLLNSACGYFRNSCDFLNFFAWDIIFGLLFYLKDTNKFFLHNIQLKNFFTQLKIFLTQLKIFLIHNVQLKFVMHNFFNFNFFSNTLK